MLVFKQAKEHRLKEGERGRMLPKKKRGDVRASPRLCVQRKGRDSNPRYGLRRTNAFQAFQFNHSCTFPVVSDLAPAALGSFARTGRKYTAERFGNATVITTVARIQVVPVSVGPVRRLVATMPVADPISALLPLSDSPPDATSAACSPPKRTSRPAW